MAAVDSNEGGEQTTSNHCEKLDKLSKGLKSTHLKLFDKFFSHCA